MSKKVERDKDGERKVTLYLTEEQYWDIKTILPQQAGPDVLRGAGVILANAIQNGSFNSVIEKEYQPPVYMIVPPTVYLVTCHFDELGGNGPICIFENEKEASVFCQRENKIQEEKGYTRRYRYTIFQIDTR